MWMDESFLIHYAGMDAAVFIRFLRLGMRLFFWSSLFLTGILIPVNITGDDGASELTALSLSNIPPGSVRLWAPVFCLWFLTLLCLYYLHHEYKEVRCVALRPDGALNVYENRLFRSRINSACAQGLGASSA